MTAQCTKGVRFTSESPAVIPSAGLDIGTCSQQQYQQRKDLSQWIDLTPLHEQIKVDVKACKQSFPEAADLYTLFDCPMQERIAFLVRLNQDNSNSVRGLERHVCKKHKVKLHCIKKGCIQAVLDLQETHRGDENLANQLKEVSEKHSRTARVFARLLAMADERVLQEEQAAETQRQPRSKSDSSAVATTMRSGNTLAQMQQSRAATSSSTRVKEAVPLPALPPPVEECDKHQTVSNAA